MDQFVYSDSAPWSAATKGPEIGQASPFVKSCSLGWCSARSPPGKKAMVAALLPFGY